MKTLPRLFACAVLFAASATFIHAQVDDDSDEAAPRSFFGFVMQLMRNPFLAARVAAVRDNMTATVSRSNGSVTANVTVTTPTSIAPITITATTTRTGSGFDSTATITPPNAPAPVQITTSVTRDNGTFTNNTTVTTPAGNVINTLTTIVPVDDDEATLTRRVTRGEDTEVFTRTILRRGPPPRG